MDTFPISAIRMINIHETHYVEWIYRQTYETLHYYKDQGAPIRCILWL